MLIISLYFTCVPVLSVSVYIDRVHMLGVVESEERSSGIDTTDG